MLDNNPFLSVSLLPYQAPRFDLISESHYRPAFDEGVRRQREEISAIVNNPAPADFTNTLVALEQSGQLLARVTSVFFAMAGADTNPIIQELDEQFSAELAELDRRQPGPDSGPGAPRGRQVLGRRADRAAGVHGGDQLLRQARRRVPGRRDPQPARPGFPDQEPADPLPPS